MTPDELAAALGRHPSRGNVVPIRPERRRTPQPDVYTVREVATHLRVGKMTVLRLIHDGHLPAYRIGQQFRIRRDDLAAYLASVSTLGDQQ
jgi:excisionase family DNA binding protein